MTFIFKMAWRDTRASRRRLLLFSFSIVLGIAALVAVGSLRDNLSAAIDTETKSLLGADLVLESRSPLTDESRAFIRSLGGEQAREESFNSMIVGPSGATRLVQVRAVESGFPFFGEFQTDPPGMRARLDTGRRAIPDETVLVQFALKPGDHIRLGGSEFEVLGGLLKVPGETTVFASFAPRVYIPIDSVEGTGLLKPGSLVRHRIYFKFRPGTNVEALVERQRDRIRSLRLSVETVEERKRDLGRSLASVNSFLSIVGFASLFLGAIGVASAVHSHVRQKIPTVAILRCLGASSVTSFSVYLVQGVALGIIGTAFGAALGIGANLLLPGLIRDFLPFTFTVSVSWPALARGVGAGLVVSLAFALLPLLEIRRVSPLEALRSSLDDRLGSRDPLRLFLLGVIVVLVVAFAVWQTGRWSFGVGLAGGLFLCFGILAGMARLVALAARSLRLRALPFAWRQGVANLHRPGNRTLLLLVSLGLGAFLMITLYLSRNTLLAQLERVGGSGRPNLMLFDIQDDQRAGLTALLKSRGAPVAQEAAIVTMRIAGLKGKPVTDLLKDEAWRNRAWTLRHEYRSTYRDHLTSTERLTAGKFTDHWNAASGPVPVSLEESVAHDLQVGLGDRLDFDVQGVTIPAVVGSLREVEWRRMQPNFFIVFPDGVLDDAPKFHVMAVHVASPKDSAAIQQAVVRDYPNVSAIDLALVIQTIDDVYAKASFVVGFLALFTVITGIIVLAGAVLIGRHQRIRESVLLRTLGATRQQIGRLLLAEYLVLGTLGALTGTVLAVVANWALARFLFEVKWAMPSPVILLGGWAAVAAVTVLTGWWAGRGIVDQPPLEVLRRET
ncbi:MAG TPA: FtsX-like permease family protein [Candidatus Didemnitutus sp.]|nr:FtsX-like permease family protein [Candidatus Didemnitutus sp.]